MDNTQLEMSFSASPKSRASFPPQPRRNRARWWFSQMRSAVDKALDWKPAPPARPEQTCLALRGNEAMTRSE